MVQKTILITGGGRGLGRATAHRLAELGHRVILTARDEASGQRSVADLRARVPSAQLEARVLDLASLASVRELGASLAREDRPLDVLFNCAGVMQQSPTRRLSRDGFEETLAVNVYAPALLTLEVLPLLRRAPQGRVVNVSSRMHLPGSRGAPVDFDFDDPQLTRGYHPDRAYKNSKLALLWVTHALEARLRDGPVTVNAVCPGFVPETAAQSARGFQRLLLRYALVHLSFARSVAEAVESFVFMALDPSLVGVRGQFYAEQQPFPPSAESLDPEKAERFWALFEKDCAASQR